MTSIFCRKNLVAEAYIIWAERKSDSFKICKSAMCACLFNMFFLMQHLTCTRGLYIPANIRAYRLSLYYLELQVKQAIDTSCSFF